MVASKKMKAAVLNGPGTVDVIEKDIPTPGAGEVLIKVRYCGICGSDVHAYDTGFFPPGMIFGHEYVGEIVKTGSGAEKWKAGDLVCGNNVISCGKCRLCRSGRENICTDMQRIGVFQDGAMAEYLVVPAESLFPFPASHHLASGAMAEPLSIALHGVNISGVNAREDDTVCVILGAGTIGLCVLAVLKYMGNDNVVVIEKDAHRAEVALAMGAGTVFDPTSRDTSDRVSRILDSGRDGIIFECAGNPAAITGALDMACQGATIVIMSICEKPVEINFLRLVTGEIRLLTSGGKTPRDFAKAVELLSTGEIDLSPLIAMAKGIDIVPGIIASLASGESREIKVIIEP